jgi:hypothetical protein
MPRSSPNGDLQTRNETLPRGEEDHNWNDVDVSKFMLRSETYLQDRKKAISGECMLEITDFDMFLVPESGPVLRSTQHPDMNYANRRKTGDDRFLVIMNFMFPPYQSCIIGALNPDAAWLQDPESPQARVWRKFVEGTEEERKDVIKILCSLDKGPWLVRRAVPQKPILIGRKVKTFSYHEPGEYLEIVFDTLSTKTEEMIVGMVCGAMRSIKFDVCVVIEAREQEEMPETALMSFAGNCLNPSAFFFPAQQEESSQG